MKKFFLLSVAATLISSLSFATIRRVGFSGIPLTGVDFANLPAAHDASAAGDTIQIYGTVSGGMITKKLVIIGFGYSFDVHPGLQAIGTPNPSSVGLIFGAGSDGSIATGLVGQFNIYDASGTHTTISSITFLRCRGNFNLNNNSSYGLISNIKILSSVISGCSMSGLAALDYPVNNLQVFNCYVNNCTLYKPNTTASFINCVGPSPLVVGAVSPLNLTDASCLVQNCILGAAGTSSNINTVFNNNFFGEPQPVTLPAGTNNRWAQVWTTIFKGITSGSEYASYDVYSSTFDDNYFILAPGSPAINGGFTNANVATDCGIFGGEVLYVYKSSGVPSVPAIYKLTAPSSGTTTNPYNVTISVRSNN